MIHVVPVDRAHVVETELLEQRAPRHHAARVLFRSLCHGLHRVGQLLRNILAKLPQLAVLLRRQQPRQVVVQGAHRRRNRHLVVVQNHDQL